MKKFSLAHLADDSLMKSYSLSARAFRGADAMLLAHMAEVDERGLYREAGSSSMFAHATEVMGFSEDSAGKRIQAARTARKFTAIFELIESGRLHLSGVCLLAPYLTSENAEALLGAAAGRTKARIEELLAERFPKPDVPASLRPVAPSAKHAPGHVGAPAFPPVPAAVASDEHAPGHVGAAGEVPGLRPERGTLSPLSPGRHLLTGTVDQRMRDDLAEAEALLGHAVRRGDVMGVLRIALQRLVKDLRRRRFADTGRPRARRSHSDDSSRHVSSEVRREVWRRDRGQCTYVSDAGHRCTERRGVEFDHVEPVAKGGRSTTANLRLRCRPHNQLEAERAYGAEFMRRRREAARAQREESRAAAERVRADAAAQAKAAAEQVRATAECAQVEVLPWLRQLGFRADEAWRAIERSAAAPGTPIQERVRLALRQLAPPGSRRCGPAVPSPA